MKQKLMDTSKESDTEPKYKKKVMVQIFKVRHLFRKQSYLATNENTINLTSIDSDILEDDLLALDEIGLNNLMNYVKKIENGEDFLMDMACVTKQEREELEKIENILTIEDFKKLICQQISYLPLDSQKLWKINLRNLNSRLIMLNFTMSSAKWLKIMRLKSKKTKKICRSNLILFDQT